MKTSPLLNKSSRIRRVATRAAGTLITLSVTSADEFLNFNTCECLFLFSFRKGRMLMLLNARCCHPLRKHGGGGG